MRRVLCVQYVWKAETNVSNSKTVHEELAKAMTTILKPSTDFLTSNKLLKVWRRAREHWLTLNLSFRDVNNWNELSSCSTPGISARFWWSRWHNTWSRAARLRWVRQRAPLWMTLANVTFDPCRVLQMSRNQRFSASFYHSVETLVTMLVPHIAQKYKDNLDATRNANHSIAVFVKVSWAL